jgi:hypothetical protein
MRESCMYGSERGARGNSRPYRTRREFITLLGALENKRISQGAVRDHHCSGGDRHWPYRRHDDRRHTGTGDVGQ